MTSLAVAQRDLHNMHMVYFLLEVYKHKELTRLLKIWHLFDME